MPILIQIILLGLGIIVLLYVIFFERHTQSNKLFKGIAIIVGFLLSTFVGHHISNFLNADRIEITETKLQNLQKSCDETIREKEELIRRFKEAEKHIILTMPDQADSWSSEIKRKEKYFISDKKKEAIIKQKRNSRDLNEVPIMLNNAISEFDILTKSFNRQYPITVIKKDVPDYFGRKGKETYLLREVTFENTRKLQLILVDGNIDEDGLIAVYPMLECRELGEGKNLIFRITDRPSWTVIGIGPEIKDVGYREGLNTDDYQMVFIKAVSEAFKKSYEKVNFRHHEG